MELTFYARAISARGSDLARFSEMGGYAAARLDLRRMEFGWALALQARLQRLEVFGHSSCKELASERSEQRGRACYPFTRNTAFKLLEGVGNR